ncbi:MAG: GntR family transcriptional regulator [SAR324 cluster bacterium]|uniref:GntR family transcriptional regulator n=1 Tax=SAR324 cluster bacterium TaxID=2024889 RepID=A0A2A4T2M6_9DELT|nr:MAG: GntR family transcriptional regulator [SAR324 cluster bacterium]
MTLLYQKIAGIIEQQINDGVFRNGEKLPSIRQLSQRFSMSIGTIQQAYVELEDRRLITPRNRSGYYVDCPQNIISTATPTIESISPTPSKVDVLEMAIAVMTAARDESLVPLGSATPNVSGLAIRQLHQSIKSVASRTRNFNEDPQGYLPLRRLIAQRSPAMGKAFNEKEIVITAGCQEALTFALKCISQAGDLIAIESPCYYGILQILEVLGRKVVEIPVSPESGIDLGGLEDLLVKFPVKGLILSPSFSNPTGYPCSDETKQGILELLKKYDLPLIEDDIYSELGKNETRVRSIQSFDREGRVILCSSISKTLCQDLRIGWMVPGRYLKEARLLKFATTLYSPSIMQMALADFLSTQRLERHLRLVTVDYAKRQGILLRLLRQHFPQETKASRPKGGFISWIELPLPLDGTRLYHQALAEGISITPGEIFSPTRQFKNFIRLNYAIADEEVMEFAIKKLAALLLEQ